MYRRHYFGVLVVLCSAIGMGMLPIFSLYAYAGNASVFTVLFLRFSIASVILFLYSYRYTALKKMQIGRKYLLSVFIMGAFFYALQSSLFLLALKYIMASLVSLFFYSYPVFVAILSMLVDREQTSLKTVLAIVTSLLGLVLILGASLHGIKLIGVILALSTGLVYSIYILMSRRVLQKASPVVTSAFVTLFTSFSIFVLGMVSGTLRFDFNPSAWWPMLGIAIFPTVIGILGFYKGIEILGPTRASVLSMVEPLATIAMAGFLFQEHLSSIQAVGAVLVLGGALLVTVSKENAAPG